ncbi:MAG: oxidoreductase [Gammaproteobacteria bacterium]|nr:SDR family NAD(P)-dependent oxidoreductase [Pseudomonadales bacterium]MCP5346906.1 SDR family NAD(P)-dependent oxidoreductase [Pseudomonadales bacterium]
MAAEQQHRIDSGFEARSEPDQILAGIDLTGKVALVTGGYSGIGLETTRALLKAGAKVHLPVRSPEKATDNLGSLEGELVMGQMDLADLASVRDYAGRVRHGERQLDLLINNAGIMACPETRVGKNWECQFATNHMGHFVLTNALLPLLRNAGTARVVSLSSIGHRRSDIRWDDIHFHRDPYDKWVAYGQAKTANALFAVGLDLKFRDHGIRAFAVHPGGILTPLQRHLEVEEMAALGWVDEDGNLSERARQLFKSPAQGCTTTLWAATSPSLNGMGGLYCEDCDVADLATETTPRHMGVESWAVDEESALRLWDVTGQMLEAA